MSALKHRILAIASTSIIATVALGLVSTPSVASSAVSKNGTYAVGKTPIKLTQPVDPGLGKLTPSAQSARDGMFGHYTLVIKVHED